jgi:hypothetical protein
MTRAQCSLNVKQATAAQADTEYALTLVDVGVPASLAEKTRSRQQQAAEAIAAQLTSAGGSGGNGPYASVSGRECIVCHQVRSADGFSGKQWRAKGHSRKCLQCVEGPGPAATAPALRQQASSPGRAPAAAADRDAAQAPGAPPVRAHDAKGGGRKEGGLVGAGRTRCADGRLEVANGVELLAVAVECGAFESDECPICLQDWQEVTCRVVIPPCSHPVCIDCLCDWSDQLLQQRAELRPQVECMELVETPHVCAYCAKSRSMPFCRPSEPGCLIAISAQGRWCGLPASSSPALPLRLVTLICYYHRGSPRVDQNLRCSIFEH